MKRRKFFGGALRAGAGLLALNSLARDSYALNDEITLAVVGING